MKIFGKEYSEIKCIELHTLNAYLSDGWVEITQTFWVGSPNSTTVRIART